jgi:hypothetical protein
MPASPSILIRLNMIGASEVQALGEAGRKVFFAKMKFANDGRLARSDVEGKRES